MNAHRVRYRGREFYVYATVREALQRSLPGRDPCSVQAVAKWATRRLREIVAAHAVNRATARALVEAFR